MEIYFFETVPGLLNPSLKKELEKYTSKVNLTKLDEESIEIISIFLSSEDSSFDSLSNSLIMHLDEQNRDIENQKILILCDNMSAFFNNRSEYLNHAVWGYSNGFISVDYSPSHAKLANQLHECLHFLKVDDCYEESIVGNPAKEECDNPNCVMRYGQTTIDICTRVKEQLDIFHSQSHA